MTFSIRRQSHVALTLPLLLAGCSFESPLDEPAPHVAVTAPESPPPQPDPPPSTTPATAATVGAPLLIAHNAPPPAVTTAASAATAPAANWPEFRGPGRSGVSPETALPLRWSATENIAWRTPLPGPGSSSPVLWNDHVYVTCYSGYGESESDAGDVDNLQRHLVCADRATGNILWQQDLPNAERVHPFEGFNQLHGYATSTPAVDADGVYVYYGSSGAAAYTHGGDLRWRQPLGADTHSWGTASSPVLYDDLVIIHADIEARTLIALRKQDGQPQWSLATGVGDSWSTPCLARTGTRDELIFHHSEGNPAAKLMSVNPRDGSILWECQALQNYLAPSPIVADGVCYAIAYGHAAAVRLGGSGNVSASHRIWTAPHGSEVCTPLCLEGRLYWAHQESGVAYCLDARTGDTIYERRLEPHPGRLYASAVLADGRIYYVSRENGTYVVAASPDFQQLAHNTISNDPSIFNATPAIAAGRLYLRSHTHLYAIGQ